MDFFKKNKKIKDMVLISKKKNIFLRMVLKTLSKTFKYQQIPNF